MDMLSFLAKKKKLLNGIRTKIQESDVKIDLDQKTQTYRSLYSTTEFIQPLKLLCYCMSTLI